MSGGPGVWAEVEWGVRVLEVLSWREGPGILVVEGSLWAVLEWGLGLGLGLIRPQTWLPCQLDDDVDVGRGKCEACDAAAEYVDSGRRPQGCDHGPQFQIEGYPRQFVDLHAT